MWAKLTKIIPALAVLSGGLLLGAAPAAANTIDVEILTGAVDIYPPGSPPVGVIDPVGALECTAPTHTITTTSPNAIDIALRYDVVTTIAGTVFRVEMDMAITGTFSGGSVSATGSAVLRLRRTSGTGSCTPTSGDCDVVWSNIGFTGSIAAANPLTLVPGDGVTLTGLNGFFDSVVTDSGTVCGPVIGHDNGYIEIPTLELGVPWPPSPVASAVTGGSLALRDTGGSTFDSIAYGALGSCSASVTAGGSSTAGSLAVASTSSRPYRSPGGTDFRVVTSLALSGSHSSGAATLAGSSTATLLRTSGGFGSCTTFGSACTVTSTDLSLTGSFSGDPTTYGTGDTLTLSGGNTAPDTVVTGSPTDCADVLTIDDGRITFTNLVLTGS